MGGGGGGEMDSHMLNICRQYFQDKNGDGIGVKNVHKFIRMSNSLDSVQAWKSFWSNLGTNCLQSFANSLYQD